MGSEDIEQVRRNTVEQIGSYLEACGLARGDMILTDVVIVAAQQGVHDADTGTSLVVSMVPTNTPRHAVHGLLDTAKIEVTERDAALYRWANSPDGDGE
jgi:hypothetical protein